MTKNIRMSSPMDFVTECYYKESVDTIKQVYSSLNKHTINMDELLEGFQTMYRPTKMVSKEIKISKPKGTRVQKELTEEEKCVAINKNGMRCKGKKLPSGANPELCSLHNNSLQKKTKVTLQAKQIPEVICDYIFTKGINRGKQCIRAPMANDTKCRLHSDKELEVPVPKMKKQEVKPVVKQVVQEFVEPEFEEEPQLEDDLGLDYPEEEEYDKEEPTEVTYPEEENFE